MSLKRMARFTVLYHQSESLCQTVARFSLEMSAAEYQYNLFYPSLAKAITNIANFHHQVTQGSYNEHESDIVEFDRMKAVWEEMGGVTNMAFNRIVRYRPQLAYHFPSRVEVPTYAVPMLRYLGFGSFDYRD